MTATTTMHRPGHPDDAPAALYLALLVLTVAILGLFATAAGGCSTVTPDPVPAPAVASFDGSALNSGILRFDQAAGAFVVTPHFVERYAALVRTYGDSRDSLTGLPYFTPALPLGFGLSEAPAAGEYHITPAAMAAFVKMNTWRRSGRQPR